MKKQPMIEVERPLWLDVERRLTLVNPRRMKTLGGFKRAYMYSYAERIIEAFQSRFEVVEIRKHLVACRTACLVEQRLASYFSVLPLEPEEVGFKRFMWRQSVWHRKRIVSIYDLAWTLWLIECDHQQRLINVSFEEKLNALAKSPKTASLKAQLERLKKRSPASAKYMQPEVVTDKAGGPSLQWHSHVERGLPYTDFKQMFGRPVHKQKFATMISVLAKLGLIAIKHHSAKKGRGNIYVPL